MISTIQSLEDFQIALSKPGKMVIDFGATWCGPCKLIAPKFKEFAANYGDVSFYKVDIDEVPEISDMLGITGVPTFIFFKDGVQVSMFSGANVKKLEDELNKLSLVKTNVNKLSCLEDLQLELQKPGGIVIDFGAEWCGPCKFIAPKFEELSAKYLNLRFFKTDVDEAPEIAEYLSVDSVPTFYFFKDGELISKFAGADLKRLQVEIDGLT